MEIERTGYARKGTYASLFPQISGSGSYQRTIKKQVMYMDFDIGGMGSMAGGSAGSSGSGDSGDASGSKSTSDGFEVGRWNTWSVGLTASMPLVNARTGAGENTEGQIGNAGILYMESVMLRAMEKIREAGLRNVAFIPELAGDLSDWFEDGEADGIYLNFSDPLPKNYWYKRRLTY